MKNIPREDFLHYVWKTTNFLIQDLKSIDGECIEIIHSGRHNPDSGPDFLEARIRIDGQLWVGHIEIHIRASDWLRHRHQDDISYDNVILHVVFQSDIIIRRSDGSRIPCLEIGPRIRKPVLKRYFNLLKKAQWIHCESFLAKQEAVTIMQAHQNALVEKLQRRAQGLIDRLGDLKNDWPQLIFETVSWSFGLKINGEAFQALARGISWNTLNKNRENLLRLEAILFGVAGLINTDSHDPYIKDLRQEYYYQKRKHGLRELNPASWKFSRMRPVGFPTLRIAQLARLIEGSDRWDEWVTDFGIADIKKILDIHIDSGFWYTSYTFDKGNRALRKSIGPDKIRSILINAVVPLRFAFGELRKMQEYKDSALGMLEEIQPESNSIVRKWSSLGVVAENAADSQGLIELKNAWCNCHKCLKCPVGHQVLRRIN